jgi:hypothetical protein
MYLNLYRGWVLFHLIVIEVVLLEKYLTWLSEQLNYSLMNDLSNSFMNNLSNSFIFYRGNTKQQ